MPEKVFSTRVDDELRLTSDTANAEIAALKSRYGTTPNAKTVAAMREADADGGEVTTIEEIMAELNAGS